MNQREEKHLSIVATEQRRVALNRKKKEVENWGVFRYPTSFKPVKSVSQLEKKVEQYFSQFDNLVESELISAGKGAMKEHVTKTNLPSVSEFAAFVGYPSANSLYKELRHPSVNTDPRYYFVLEKAVGLIETVYERRAMELGEKASDFRAYTEILKRHDTMRERLEQEDALNGTINNAGGTININMYKGFEKDMNDRITALFDSVNKDVVEAEVTEIGDEDEN